MAASTIMTNNILNTSFMITPFIFIMMIYLQTYIKKERHKDEEIENLNKYYFIIHQYYM
jgi:hypothetical protein